MQRRDQDETTESTPNNPRTDRELAICDECDRAYVGWHKCGTLSANGGGGGTTRDERDRLSALDDRPADETVVYVPGRGDSAYHRTEQGRDDDGNFADHLVPQCDAQIESDDGPNGQTRTWERERRGTARDVSTRFPCRQCHDLDDHDLDGTAELDEGET